ncbi:response regulator transcription factor [uncultured Hyphomicrobium sp.]|uniref:response regulator n=1 Tax=uncultured Hyphomicrobium sp. TaxID=194373 RepID=UPI0025DEF62D|nr:response regulator transcription factor [uncultured Hyphomicrobium sp.]
MMTKLRIAVVDDHPLMRAGVQHTLSLEEDFEVVGLGGCADDAIEIARSQSPGLMLLDVNMPGGGLNAAKEIGTACPSVRLLFLTVSERMEDVTAALEAGVRGYVLKGIGGPDLVRTIRSVASGETYITPDFAARLLAAPATRSKERDERAPLEALTIREEQILREVSLGLTNKEIARKLDLSEKTIKHYMSGVLHKLSARNRVEAIVASRRLKDSDS